MGRHFRPMPDADPGRPGNGERVRRPAQNTTCPDMPGCTSPPIQISPLDAYRPRRPKAVPWLAV